MRLVGAGVEPVVGGVEGDEEQYAVDSEVDYKHMEVVASAVEEEYNVGTDIQDAAAEVLEARSV